MLKLRILCLSSALAVSTPRAAHAGLGDESWCEMLWRAQAAQA